MLSMSDQLRDVMLKVVDVEDEDDEEEQRG